MLSCCQAVMLSRCQDTAWCRNSLNYKYRFGFRRQANTNSKRVRSRFTESQLIGAFLQQKTRSISLVHRSETAVFSAAQRRALNHRPGFCDCDADQTCDCQSTKPEVNHYIWNYGNTKRTEIWSVTSSNWDIRDSEDSDLSTDVHAYLLLSERS